MQDTVSPNITLGLDDFKRICTLAYHGLNIVRGQYQMAEELSDDDAIAWQQAIDASTDAIAEYESSSHSPGHITRLIETLATDSA